MAPVRRSPTNQPFFRTLLGVVAVLALRFGYDSRETAFSKEEELAGFGLTPDQPGKLTTQREHPYLTTEASELMIEAVSQPSYAD